jgi:hypothetical protein
VGRIYSAYIGAEKYKYIDSLECYDNSRAYMLVFYRGGLGSIPVYSIEIKSSIKKKCRMIITVLKFQPINACGSRSFAQKQSALGTLFITPLHA